MSNPKSPASNPEEEEELMVEIPGFVPDPTMMGPDPLDPTTTRVTTETGTPEDPTTAGEAGDVGGEAATKTSSSRASTPDGPAAMAGLEEMTRMLVAMASMLVRWIRQRASTVPLPPDVWVATEQDQAAIGDPLARIASRHAPVVGEGAEDLTDGLSAAMGTVAYGVHNLQVEAAVEAAVAYGTYGQESDEPTESRP